VSAYGRSKLLGEEAAAASGAPVVILRPSAVYGPRDRDVLVFFRLAARGIGLAVGDPARQLSLIHVSDLVTLMLRAAEETRALSKTYFVNDGRIHSVGGLMRAVGRAVGRRIVILRVPPALLWAAARVEEWRAMRLGTRPLLTRERAREYRDGAWISDGGLARAELAAPAVEIERGLAETAAWYRENGWL
jgi:nucleoside-diphosphate-sugar epimerase